MRFRRIAPLVLLLVPGGCARRPALVAAKAPDQQASTAPASTAPVSAAPAPEAPPPTPTPLPYEAGLGKIAFMHYCKTCHGESGAGDGFNAFNLDPHPRDLSDPDFQKKKSDAELADAIQRGGAGVGLSALMPPWGHTLSTRQIDELVRYLRTLPRKPAS